MDVGAIGYKPGWQFKLAGPLNRFLCVYVTSEDTVRRGTQRTTQHMFEVPDGLEDRDLARWVFAQLLQVERHEAAEWFAWDGRPVFWPNHQDEGSPYVAVERWET